MKVLFWGTEHGCGTTSSMAAVASYLSLHTPNRSICVQSKSSSGDLEFFFKPWERRLMLKEESTYFALEGMDYLIWQEQHHSLDMDAVKDVLMPLFDYRMHYILRGARDKPGLYPEQTMKLQQKILSQLEQSAEYIFVDIGCGKNDCLDQLLECADLLVVNLCGRQEEVYRYFNDPLPYEGKRLFLLSNSNYESVYNAQNLSRIYRIQNDDIFMVPMNAVFAQACMRGRMEAFMKKSKGIHQGDRHAAFFMQLQKITNRVMEVTAHE